MATVQEFINDTLVLLGVLDPGETPSSSDSDSAFRALNRLLSNWSAALLYVPKLTKDTLATSGVASFTLGTGGTLTTTRPLKLRSAACVAAGVSMPIEILSAEQWAAVKDKTRAGKFAQVGFYDAGYPTATLTVTPTPSGSTLEVYSLKPLSAFGALSDTIDLMPGYEMALQFALAAAIAPSYGRPTPPEIQAGSQSAPDAIAKLNADVLGIPIPAEAPQKQ